MEDEKRDPKGRFLTGNSGGGRPKGSRNKLGEQFIEDFYEDWREHGKTAIAAMRRDKPNEYVRVAASILPKELNLKVDPLEELSDADLDKCIRQFASLVGLEIRAHAPLGGEGEADDEGQTAH
jgi:hypothetical protein